MEMVNCPNKDCAAMVYRYEMAVHVEKCPHKCIACADCEGKVKFIDITKHQNICPKTTITCPNNCGKTFIEV